MELPANTMICVNMTNGPTRRQALDMTTLTGRLRPRTALRGSPLVRTHRIGEYGCSLRSMQSIPGQRIVGDPALPVGDGVQDGVTQRVRRG
jgi:hypothetical protein